MATITTRPAKATMMGIMTGVSGCFITAHSDGSRGKTDSFDPVKIEQASMDRSRTKDTDSNTCNSVVTYTALQYVLNYNTDCTILSYIRTVNSEKLVYLRFPFSPTDIINDQVIKLRPVPLVVFCVWKRGV